MKRPLRGVLEGIVQDRIQGWASHHENPKQATEIAVRINHQKVVHVQANRNRSDVQKAGHHPTGKCGFQVELTDFPDLETIQSIEAWTEPDFTILSGSPLLFDPPVPVDRYFFLHVPKTAGTSFRAMLATALKQDQIFPNQNQLDAYFNGNYPLLKDLEHLTEFNKGVKLLQGHFPFGADQLFFGHRAKTIIILREPISRTISNVKHIQKHFPRGRSMTFQQIIAPESPFLEELKNRQVRMLSHDPQSNKPTMELETAKRHLQACYFVGLTETFEQDVRAFEQLSGLSLGPVRKSNVSDGSGNLSDQDLERLKALNDKDLELYTYAKGLKELPRE